MERGRRRHPRSSQRSACCPAMPPLSTPCRPGWRACSPTLPLRASPSARCRYLHRAWRQALVPRLAPARDAATRMRASSPAPQCAGPSPAAYAHCAPAPAWTQNNSVQCLVGVHVKARRMQRASLPCLRAVYGLSTARRCACSGWLFLRDNGPVLRYGMGSAQVLELARLMEYQGRRQQLCWRPRRPRPPGGRSMGAPLTMRPRWTQQVPLMTAPRQAPTRCGLAAWQCCCIRVGVCVSAAALHHESRSVRHPCMPNLPCKCCAIA